MYWKKCNLCSLHWNFLCNSIINWIEWCLLLRNPLTSSILWIFHRNYQRRCQFHDTLIYFYANSAQKRLIKQYKRDSLLGLCIEHVSLDFHQRHNPRWIYIASAVEAILRVEKKLVIINPAPFSTLPSFDIVWSKGTIAQAKQWRSVFEEVLHGENFRFIFHTCSRNRFSFARKYRKW